MTDASEQDNSGLLGGPVTIQDNITSRLCHVVSLIMSSSKFSLYTVVFSVLLFMFNCLFHLLLLAVQIRLLYVLDGWIK